MNESLSSPLPIKAQRLILVLLVAATYGVALCNGFVWDDRIYFIGNPVYKDFNLRALFFSLANGVEYLPLRDLTYAFDYLLWGESPFGFHLTNLLFFTGNALLAFQLARQICHRLAAVSNRLPAPFTPLAAAVLFSIHPLNAEAANFVTCRNVLVSGLFFFSACLSFSNYLEAPTKKKYTLVVIFFICAMLGKATAIMLPLLLLLTMPLLFPGRFREIARATAPLFAIAAGFFVVFIKIAEKAGFVSKAALQLTLHSFAEKVAVASQIPYFYLKKFLLPYGFSADYIVNFSHALLSFKTMAALAAGLLLTVLAFACRSKFPEFILGLCWFMAALVPVLNFFATNPLLADRYAYLPVFGLSVCAATAFERITAVRLKSIIAVLLCLLLAGVSVSRSREWRSNETLWQANIRNFPAQTKSYLSLAGYYFANNEHQKAISLLTANSTVPWIDVYRYYFIGCDEMLKMNLFAAKEAFQKSLTVLDGFIGALFCLGTIAEEEGAYLAAIGYYNRALASSNPDFFFQVPIIKKRVQELHLKHIDPLISSLKQKVAANSADKAAHRDLALLFDQLGLYDSALEEYLLLRKMGIKSGQLLQNIAHCYFRTNRSNDAVRFYEEALAVDSGDLSILNNLGISYRKLGQYNKSIETLTKAIESSPNSPYPALNLGITYAAAGRKEEAVSTFTDVSGRFPELRDMTAFYLKELSNK